MTDQEIKDGLKRLYELLGDFNAVPSDKTGVECMALILALADGMKLNVSRKRVLRSSVDKLKERKMARPGYFSLSLLVRVKFTLDLTTGEQSNETQHGG